MTQTERHATASAALNLIVRRHPDVVRVATYHALRRLLHLGLRGGAKVTPELLATVWSNLRRETPKAPKASGDPRPEIIVHIPDWAR